MRKHLYSIVIGLGLILGLVTASAQMRIDGLPSVIRNAVLSGFSTSGSAPSVANVGANSCGTSAATIAGNDNTGIITIGATSGTQCRVTFTRAATTRWQCMANNESTSNIARTTNVSTTAMDFFGTFVGGDVVAYICLPR